MNTLSATASPPQATQPDFATVKARQQAAWSSGDYAVVGTTLQIVGESLAEAMDLRAGATVLDVAAGNGNVSLAAARRWCRVTSTDYVGALLSVPYSADYTFSRKARASSLPGVGEINPT